MSHPAVTFLVLALVGCVSQPVAVEGADTWRRIATALKTSNAADADWVAAALLSFGAKMPDPIPPAEVREAWDRAVHGPQDRAVSVALLGLCDRSTGCDVGIAAERLRDVDPGNGVALLPALQEAVEAGNDQRIDEVLARMAESDHWNIYFNEVVTRVTRALVAASPYMSRSDARNYADFEKAYVNSAGLTAAFLLPRVESVSRACANPSPERRSVCLRIVKSMQTSDTLLVSGFGASMTLRLAPRGSADHDAAIAARRRHEWQLNALQTVSPNKTLREYPELAGRLPREQDVASAIMQQHGIALEPPAGWRPAIGSDEIGRPK